MDDLHNTKQQMKSFIVLTEELLAHYASTTMPIDNTVLEKEIEVVEHPIVQECKDIVFKLRAFMEDASGGDYALGIEIGMQRAADMIDNLIKRYENKDDNFE